MSNITYNRFRASLIMALFLCIAISCLGCAQKAAPLQAKLSFTFLEAVPFIVDGFKLSSPLIYPDIDGKGLFIAAENSNNIFHYDRTTGMELFLSPVEVPPGAQGIRAFCLADGDFITRPPGGPGTALYRLTRKGRIRPQELPAEATDDVQSFGEVVYFGDSRIFIETHPKGPFIIHNLLTGQTERPPAEFPKRDLVQAVVPNFAAEEIYLVRRAPDMSVYYLRYPFKGGYRGVGYIHGRDFFTGASRYEESVLLQYADGVVDVYDRLKKLTGTYELKPMTGREYTMLKDLAVIENKAYLIGVRGMLTHPDGYDLLVFTIA